MGDTVNVSARNPALEQRLRDAFANGSHEVITTAFEAYMTWYASDPQRTGHRLRYGERTLTWLDLVEEVRNKTRLGMGYLEAMKESFERMD